MYEKYYYFPNGQGDFTVCVLNNVEDDRFIAICLVEKDAKLITDALNHYDKTKSVSDFTKSGLTPFIPLEMRKPKPSELLEQKAAEEDNDLKAMGIMGKAIREKRAETWEDWKDEFQGNMSKEVISYGDHINEMGKVVLTTKTYGVIDYFPKANKVLIRKENKWIKPGLKWLIKNLVHEKS